MGAGSVGEGASCKFECARVKAADVRTSFARGCSREVQREE